MEEFSICTDHNFHIFNELGDKCLVVLCPSTDGIQTKVDSCNVFIVLQDL